MDGLEAEAADACHRVTGLSAGEWEAEFRKRRRFGFASSDLHTGRFYTVREMAQMYSRYGLDDVDMIACKVPVEVVRALRRYLDVPTHNGRQADYVVMYRLNPERFGNL